ncbi:hypothetical protein MAPG_07767 [Magnaporthiopsis poae ATCC 64411]|uniref:Uncharacterized protein n=1 Tax=Magnaporthiopsis poae (strain ATCC 64411 / 73-15) TaxID=644358 RepID=A0A0C4E5J6_MAGP6|nr:hypothetical protein MAPG_07767 [Magnaporthiopsis poae ATCC 64411]
MAEQTKNGDRQKRHALSWVFDSSYATTVPFYAWYFFKSQLTRLPEPKGDNTFNGQTVIVTGANVGLGLEAARTIVRLGAGKPARAAKGVVECWQVDVGSLESVKAFCARAESSLGRVDVLVANAGVAIPRYVACDGGLESTVAVNVVGALLMAVLLLPAMRRTAARFNVEPRVSFVGSDAHQFARFAERHVSEGDRILDAFYDPDRMDTDRYNVSKVMILMCARELARRLDEGSGNNPVIVNALNPGMCRSQLFRHTPFPLNWILAVGGRIVGRSSEEGARTLVAGAAAGRESHGRYMLDCVVVDGAESPLVRSDEGRAVQVKVFDEIMDDLEKVQPGIRKIVAGSA